jgi:hypothetical protein
MPQDNRSAIKAHHQTYDGFIRILKIGAIASFLIAALVVVVISS